MNEIADNGASITAREIAKELARLLRREPQGEGHDPKRLGDVQPVLLNIDQAAKYLGRTVRGIRDLMTKGVLVPVRFDRKIQFKRRDLDDLIEKYTGWALKFPTWRGANRSRIFVARSGGSSFTRTGSRCERFPIQPMKLRPGVSSRSDSDKWKAGNTEGPLRAEFLSRHFSTL